MIINFFRKIFRKKALSYLATPMLYTSIPIHISKKEWAIILKEEHLLLQERIVERSVVFIDEIGAYVCQWEYKNVNVLNAFDEFIRLFRHYTLGGYFVCTDQSSDNIVVNLRRRINSIINLLHFHKILFVFWVKSRNISLSEDIKTIEEKNVEDNSRIIIGFINPFFKTYDTYCYSQRYDSVPSGDNSRYYKLKKNHVLRINKEKIVPKTNDKECS